MLYFKHDSNTIDNLLVIPIGPASCRQTDTHCQAYRMVKTKRGMLSIGDMIMRKGCRTSKTEKACSQYSYQLGRCVSGKVKATCSLVQQPKPNTKAGRNAQLCRDFYA